MSEPFVGEIRMFAGSFAPRGWAFCDGQLLAVMQNDALFSLLGTIYGGDGRTTFGLPDMRGRIPVHAGSGPGLSTRKLGAKGGAEQVTLATTNLPAHSHQIKASADAGSRNNPEGKFQGASPNVTVFRPNETPNVAFDAASITNVGGSGDHTNLMPFLCVNFIIALIGTYPSRQ